jgi:hypothetical protein
VSTVARAEGKRQAWCREALDFPTLFLRISSVLAPRPTRRLERPRAGLSFKGDPNDSCEEKSIDVRPAIDVIRKAHRQEFDVALIFSQDQDLSEVARELRQISREQRRWIKVASAHPRSPTSTNRRGIDQTDWIPIDRATYDACLDRRDYRAKDIPEGESGP